MTCRFCGAADPGWGGGRYCNPACAERAVEAVIARVMRDMSRPSQGRPPKPSGRWCRYCGVDLPGRRDNRQRFCCRECREAYRVDIAASKGAVA